MDIAKPAATHAIQETLAPAVPLLPVPSPAAVMPVTVAAKAALAGSFDGIVGRGVIALTVVAAASVMLGSWSHASQPKELLPLMIVRPAG